MRHRSHQPSARRGSAESDGSARGDTAGRAHNRQGRCGDSRTILAAAHLREDCRTEIGVAGRFPPLSHTRSDIVRDYYILGSVLFSDLFSPPHVCRQPRHGVHNDPCGRLPAHGISDGRRPYMRPLYGAFYHSGHTHGGVFRRAYGILLYISRR